MGGKTRAQIRGMWGVQPAAWVWVGMVGSRATPQVCLAQWVDQGKGLGSKSVYTPGLNLGSVLIAHSDQCLSDPLSSPLTHQRAVWGQVWVLPGAMTPCDPALSLEGFSSFLLMFPGSPLPEEATSHGTVFPSKFLRWSFTVGFHLLLADRSLSLGDPCLFWITQQGSGGLAIYTHFVNRGCQAPEGSVVFLAPAPRPSRPPISSRSQGEHRSRRELP